MAPKKDEKRPSTKGGGGGGAAGVTPAPPRYPEGEAPPLPDWPINWSCVGMRIETLLGIDAQNLVDTFNETMRPAMSMAIVDAMTMANEEMAVDPPTELGDKLKEAKESGARDWLTPQLVTNVLHARSLLDKDDEHRKEEERRTMQAEKCKKDIEDAKVVEAEAKQAFEESLLKLKECEDKVREKELAEQFVPPVEAAPVEPPKGKAPAKPAGKAPPPTPATSLEDELKALQEKSAELRTALQCYEKKVKIAQYHDVKQDSERCDPCTTTRIYWCLGLGDTPEALAQQATVKHIFRAILHLAKKPPPPPPPPGEAPPPPIGEADQPAAGAKPPGKAPEKKLSTIALAVPPGEVPEPTPLPPFIEQLMALAKVARPDHPARGIPVIDALYEDPPVEAAPAEAMPPPAATPPAKGKPLAVAPKGAPVATGLPYGQLAKAVAEATLCLMEQIKAFDALAASITEACQIPDAIPSKDVSTAYYKALLNEVPVDLVSIPVLLHCMIEQVSVYDCPIEDLEALEVAKANKKLAAGLDSSFQRLGHGLSCMRKQSDFLVDLIEKFESEHEAEELRKKLEEEEAVAAAAEEEARLAAKGGGNKRKSTLSNKQVPEELASNLAEGAGGIKKLSAVVAGSLIAGADNKKSTLKSLSLQAEADHESSSKSSTKASEHSSTRTLQGEEHLHVVHEFSRVGRLEDTQQVPLQFLDSVDVLKVEKHMLSLLGYPGKKRESMPITPFLSEEKRAACLEALRLYASGGPQEPAEVKYPIYKELDDIYGPPVVLEILEDPDGPKFSLVPVNLAAVQRYRKLKMFLESLLEEEKRAFHIPGRPKDCSAPKESESESKATSTPDSEPCLTAEQIEAEKEKYLVDCGCPGIKIYRFPDPMPPHLLDPSSKSSSIEEPPMFLPFQGIITRRMIEAFPDGLLGEVFCNARIRLPYEIRRYDRDEDCILKAIYADEREHEWEGTVPSQMGFYDFVANMHAPSPSMLITTKHPTYDVLECYATILERFRCHLTEDQGLVWAGLAAKSPIQWEPSTTVIKDGNLVFLRGYGPNDSSESHIVKSVIAWLRDGIVVCFFIASDGTMSMQVTTPASQTIEITSKGTVSMFSSELHIKKEAIEEATDTEEPKEAESAAPPPPPPPPAKGGKEPPKGKDAKAADVAPAVPVEGEESEGQNKLPISNTQTIREIILKEKGDIEAWRCVLPSGTVVRYKQNGDAQVLCRQGNVSDFRKDFEGGSCWITANNQGFLVLQKVPAKEDVPVEPEAPAPDAGKGGKDAKAPPPKKASIKEAPPIEEPPVEVMEPEPELKPKPELTRLPDLKLAHFYDPDTGDEVMTREDLVVVINSLSNQSTLVQHADGTHIYSEIREIYELEHQKTSGELMMDQITEVFPSGEKKEPEGNSKRKEDSHNIIGTEGDRKGSKIEAAKKTSVAKPPPDGGKYEKKHPLIGTEAEVPMKPGLKLSTFAKAQKKHSQTWVPEGYAEAPKEVPPWVWPPLGPEPKLQRYSTPPPEEPEPETPPPIPPEISTTWHVRKEGLAKVHGKIGAGVCVEFSTVDGHYAATWSKETSQISLTMPGGAILYAIGTTVTYDTSGGIKKHDPKQAVGDHKDDKFGPTVNTNGNYIFDVVEGSLVYTDNAGSGFKVFGRGTDFEAIIGGKYETQLKKEAEEYEKILAAWAAEMPEGLQENLDKREAAKYFPNDPPALQRASIRASLLAAEAPTAAQSKKKSISKAGEKPKEEKRKDSKRASVKGEGDKRGSKASAPLGEGLKEPKKLLDPFDGFELSPPGEWKPPVPLSRPTTPSISEPPEPIMLGPYPRLFVIHEGGHGYEFLTEEMYQLYEIAKFHNKHCTKNDEKYVISDEECTFHTFVTIESEKSTNLNELLKNEEKTQTNFPISPLLLTRKVSQFARRFQAKQRNTKVQTQTKCDWLQLEFMLPNLPRIINPVVPKLKGEDLESKFVYRQIVETPFISEETRGNIDKILEAYAKWQWENLELQQIEIIPDTRTEEELEMERYIACRIREKLAEQEVHKARKRESVEIEYARRIIRQKQREAAKKGAELARQQKILQDQIDEDWRLFVEKKDGAFVCMHKPTDLLQTEPPFHPLPNIRFLFFHAEEGLRYLFICQQRAGEEKRWSIETMPPSPKSSIHSNEFFANLTQDEENQLTDMFSGMIGKVEELAQETLKTRDKEKLRKEGETFCKQVFSELLVHKDPLRDFTAEYSSDAEQETCLFDYPPKLEKKKEPRPKAIKNIRPTLPPHICKPPTPPCTCPPPPSPPPPIQVCTVPEKCVVAVPSIPKPPELSQKEKNRLAREAWCLKRQAEKEARAKILGPNWMIPQEFDYHYEIIQRARLFQKPWRLAKWKRNNFYLEREKVNERPMHYQSIERMHVRPTPAPYEWVSQQFRIIPHLIDFKFVKLGTMKMKIALVQNYHGFRCGRIYIHKQDKLSVKFHYWHGLIAPGMYTILRVYFRASVLGFHSSHAEIVTDTDMFHLPIRAIVIEGEPPIGLDDVIDEEDRDPCDEPIDPWGSFILCRKCLTHHLAWWSVNLGYYECQKCWHFHITQEWLNAIAEKERLAAIAKGENKAPKSNKEEPGILGPPWA